MAGVFESVLDVAGEAALLAAVDEVHASGRPGPRRRSRRRRDGRARAADAATPRWGGVLFGADPLTGRHDRHRRRRRRRAARTSSCRARSTAGRRVLDRRGRVRRGPLDGRRAAPAGRRAAPPGPPRRATPAAAFGGPQDIEWAVDADGAAAPAAGPADHDAAADVGHGVRARPGRRDVPRPAGAARAGPVARPAARRPARGAAAHRHDRRHGPSARSDARRRRRRHRRRRPGALLGVDAAAGGRAAPPRSAAAGAPPARGVARRSAAQRARRRSATDLVAPRRRRPRRRARRSTSSPTTQLLAVLRNGRRTLVSLHGHEALVGLLIPSRRGGHASPVPRWRFDAIAAGAGRGRLARRARRARSPSCWPSCRRASAATARSPSSWPRPRSRPSPPSAGVPDRRGHRPGGAAPAGPLGPGADGAGGAGDRRPPRRHAARSAAPTTSATWAGTSWRKRSVAHACACRRSAAA